MLSRRSRYVASWPTSRSRVPARSPARIMLTNIVLKASGCAAMAPPRVSPLSRRVATSSRALDSVRLVVSLARLRRPRTRGTPASSTVENWLLNRLRSRVPTRPWVINAMNCEEWRPVSRLRDSTTWSTTRPRRCRWSTTSSDVVPAWKPVTSVPSSDLAT